MTAWDNIKVLMLFVLVPALAVMLLVLLVRVLRPVAERSVIVRMMCRLIGIGIVTLVVFVSLWVVLVVLFEAFGEREVAPWLPLGAPALIGAGFYAWGRFAWRIKREALIGPRCNRCGYDLAGLTLTPRPPCPECGKVLPANERRLFKPRLRKWATRLGAFLIAGGLIVPPAVSVYRHGWVSQVPTWVLLRMLVNNWQADAARQALGERRVGLGQVDPHWTRDLMVSFADEYDAATAGGKTPPWTIYNRMYALYQAGNDAGTVRLTSDWCSSPSGGRRIVATTMMTLPGFAPAEDRLRLMRPLLADPEPAVRINALRAMTSDGAMPLSELLSLVRARDTNKLHITELSSALSHYTEPSARAARIEMAADAADPWADVVTWHVLFEVFDFSKNCVRQGGLSELARAKVVVPTARTAWTRGSFDLVYRSLIEAAAAKPGTAGEDAQTAAWCRAAIKSYATTAPMTVPGAPASLKPAILLVLDATIAAEADGAVLVRLKALRNEISPGDAPADEGLQRDEPPGAK